MVENNANKCKICLKEFGQQNLFLSSEEQLICRICFDIQICNYEFQQPIDKQLKKKDISEILPKRLYLGNRDSSLNLQILEYFNISHILIAGTQMKQEYPKKFSYYTIEIEDDHESDIYQHFEKCLEFIINSKIVFIHCQAGVNRSPTIVIAYLMKINQWPYHKAFDFVKSRRPFIGKNPNFVKQLQKWEKTLAIQQQEEFEKQIVKDQKQQDQLEKEQEFQFQGK